MRRRGHRSKLTRPTAAASPARPAARAWVLVVDDDPVARAIARSLLERHGCAVETAVTGAEALDRLVAFEHDLVLLDCRLPVMDGFEVARRYRRTEGVSGRARVPIVATTADALEETRRACLEAGMSDHLAKPWREAELASVLERWLPGAEAARATAGRNSRGRTGRIRAEWLPAGALRDAYGGGGPDSALELAELFAETLQSGRGELLAALLEGREVDAADIAHRLHGAAAAVGESDLAATLAEVESAGHEVGSAPKTSQVDASLRQAVARARRLARRLRAAGPAAAR